MLNTDNTFRQSLVSLLPRLRRFATALTGSEDDAEDLVQSAVERALREWRPLRSHKPVDAWMFGILQDTWMSDRRSQRGTGLPRQALEVVGEDGRELAANRRDLRAAQDALSALPIEQRAVIALVVIDGLSYQEAAVAMDVPVGTIMSRLARARAQIISQVKGVAPALLAKDER